jgi:endonuclease/exonuclease/phosphatase (EEP) superfamily protein YafD
MRIMIFPCFFWTLGNWVFEYPRTNIYQLCLPLQVTCKSLILSSGTIVAGYMCTCVYVAKALAACPGALCWDARERGGLYVLVIEIAMDHKKWMVNICKHHDLIWFTYCNTLKRSTSRCEIARGYIYIYHGYDAMHAYIYIYTRL